MAKVLMGIDIGTSAVKVGIFDFKGQVIAWASEAYETQYPQPGFVQQNVNQWWAQTCRCVKACLQQMKGQVAGEDIAAIGVDGQSWSCIPIDEKGAVLYPNPIWQDTRSSDLCKEINNQPWSDQLLARCGNPLQPFYTTGKILWLKKWEPTVYQRTRYFLQSNSYIVYCLTGQVSQDQSQCYGLHVYDAKTSELDMQLCNSLGIDPKKLPPVYPCSQVVGRVNESAALATGLPQGIPVVAGGLDAACGTLGAGVHRHKQVQEQGGQAGGMSICMNSPCFDKRLILSRHVLPGLWLLQGGTVSGGASMEWIARTIGQWEEELARTGQSTKFELITQLAAKTPPGAAGLIFLPYLMGERSPIWDADACGLFFGLTFATTKGHLYRSVMEGVAYALRHNLEVAREAGGLVDTLVSVGGAASSPLWMQMKADICQKTFIKGDDDGFASSRGAAVLAGLGVGVYNELPAFITKGVDDLIRYTPNPEHKQCYDKNFALYKQLYQQTAPLLAQRALG